MIFYYLLVTAAGNSFQKYQMKKLSTSMLKSVVLQLLKTSRPLLLAAGFICLSVFANAQVTITAIQDGDWSDPATWDGGEIPTAADDVIIGNGFTVYINTTDATCGSLRAGLGDGTGSGGFSFVGTSSLTVIDAVVFGDVEGAAGTITMDAGATFTCGSVIEEDPGFSGIFETNLGTIIFTGTFTLPYNFFQFNNLIIDGGSVTTGDRNLPIEGDLSILSGGTLDLEENTANRNTIAGTFTVSNGSTLRIGGGGTIPANFTNHSIGATSTIEYYGVAQTVATLNSSQNYGHLIISGSGLKEVNGSIGIAGNLTVNGGIFSTNTFSANRTSAGGTLTVANGATLRIAGSGTLPSNYSTHVIGAGSTIEYSGTSAQNIAVLNSSQIYGNLNVFNSVKSLTGSITVAGTLAFGGTPNRLAIGANTLTLEGPVTGSLTGSRNFTASASSHLVVNGAYNRSIFMDATTPGTTNALNTLTLNHASNISTLGNDMVVNNNLILTAGKLSIAARTLTLKGNIVNTVSEGIRGGSSSKMVINGNQSLSLSMDQTTPGTTNNLSTLQINSSGQVISLSSNLQMGSTLTFTAGKLAINDQTLTLKGLVVNTVTEGLRAGANCSLVVNGTVSPSLSFDQTTPGSTNAIGNFTVNSSGQTVTLLNALRLTGTHTPTAGVLATGGNYTVASTSVSTANIAAGSTSGGYITGDVTVERYIPRNTNRGWRLIACPTSGQTIHEAWQEGQAAGINGNPHYGTMITSNSGSWSSNGFDYHTPGSSLYTYDAAIDELVPVTSTSAAIADEQGYFIYIRGSRAVTPSSSITAVDSTILRTTGDLYTGNQSAIAVAADKFAMVGNPFASALDLRNIATTGGCTGTSFYVWDPKLAGAYSLGAFQTLTPSGGNFVVVPGGGSYGTGGSIVNTVQSGAAFQVQATGASGTVSIGENCKTAGSEVVFRPVTGGNSKQLFANIYADYGTEKKLADGNMIFFDDSYAAAIDEFDSRKLYNFGETFGITNQSIELAVERKPNPVNNDTIRFVMYNLKKMAYSLQLSANGFSEPGLLAFLEDRHLNSSTFISLNDTTNYAFTVDNNPASYNASRFYIVFRQTGVLPVKFVSLHAVKATGKVLISWTAQQQENVARYEVERSYDGNKFVKIAENSVERSGTYDATDNSAATGLQYYRIKCIHMDGSYLYSNIAKVTGTMEAPFTVHPNPVRDGKMNIVVDNKEKGVYTISFINMAGQNVYTTQLKHTGAQTMYDVKLPAGTPSGIYQVLVTSPANEKTRLSIILTN
jgi:hypothetical protein